MTTPFHRPRFGSRLIELHNVSVDNVDDVIGTKVRRMQSIEGWTAEKKRLRSDLEAICPWFGYVGWTVDPRDYLVQRVGESFLYDVPINKRGNLAAFRGKRVRVICLGSGAFTRWVRVGPVNPLDVETPSPERSTSLRQQH